MAGLRARYSGANLSRYFTMRVIGHLDHDWFGGAVQSFSAWERYQSCQSRLVLPLLWSSQILFGPLMSIISTPVCSRGARSHQSRCTVASESILAPAPLPLHESHLALMLRSRVRLDPVSAFHVVSERRSRLTSGSFAGRGCWTEAIIPAALPTSYAQFDYPPYTCRLYAWLILADPRDLFVLLDSVRRR